MENKIEKLNEFIKKWEHFEINNISDWIPVLLEDEIQSCYDQASELFDIGDLECVRWNNENGIGYTISEFENMVANLVECAIDELNIIKNKEKLADDNDGDYKFEKSACTSIVRVEQEKLNKIFYSVWIKERNFYKKFYLDEYEVCENKWFIKFKKMENKDV